MRTHISARDVPRDKPRKYAMFMNASLWYICRVLTLCCFNSHCFADTKQFAFMGVFVTTDGAPALSYSRSRNYQAVFGMHDDFQQSVRWYGLDEQGDIQDFRLRVTRLAQSLEPGSNVTSCANGMESPDVDFDHITEQPSHTDIEALQAMTSSDDKKKAGTFTIWANGVCERMLTPGVSLGDVPLGV
jgi:hypothetical protein